MISRALPVVGCLALSAAAVAWPGGKGRARRVLGGHISGHRPAVRCGQVAAALAHWPIRRAIGVAAAGCGVAGALLGGPVAAIVAAAYGGIAVRAVIRSRRDRVAGQLAGGTLDALSSLAADLRAGLPPLAAWESLGGAVQSDTATAPRPPHRRRGWSIGARMSGLDDRADDRIRRLTTAAWRFAEQTGAPLADLIERVESDARSADRARAAAAAQAAGATATAWLLGALPVGGIALGFAIGVDPLRVLLHTPLGAGCALTALALQLAGLLWAERLGARRVA